MPKTIHVVSPVAGFGNSLDLELVSSLLENAGFEVTRYRVQARGKITRSGKLALQLLKFPRRFDIQIFLAPIFPEWLPVAKKNVLVPNAEGFHPHMAKWLPRIDLVLAKTRLTEEIFQKLGCETAFTSFTSPDHLDESVVRDDRRFFHTCSSQFKGTRRLLEVWQAHPEWPELVAVVNHNDTITADMAGPNVRLIREALSNEEIRRLQNSIRFHICSSEAEGFGHYIMEGMSCRAVTLVTNAPPMNELAQPDRALLLDCLEKSDEMNLSRRYYFDPKSLETQVERAIKMDTAAIQKMGSTARDFFVANDQAFRRRLVEIMNEL